MLPNFSRLRYNRRMRVIRLRSIYDERDEARRAVSRARLRMWPVWLVGGGVVIGVGVSCYARFLDPGAWSGGIWLLATWAVIVPLVVALGWAGSQSQGEAGENAALNALCGVGDDYIAITNFKIPGYERIGDLDIVLAGPVGVVVVEVKNLRGPWRVDGDRWVSMGDRGPGLRRGVGGQLKGQVKALASFLGRAGAPCRVIGLIAVNSNAAIEIASPGPYPIVPYDRLATVIAAESATAGRDALKARETLCSIATTS